MTNLSRIGCDLVDAPLLSDGAPMPEDAACDDWRRDWPQQVEEAGASDLLVLPGPQLIGEHEVDGRTVGSRSADHAALITETLDDIERRAHEAGVTHVQVATMPCREVDPDRLDPSLRQFAGPISDPANIGWVNDVIRAWARGEGGSQRTSGCSGRPSTCGSRCAATATARRSTACRSTPTRSTSRPRAPRWSGPG